MEPNFLATPKDALVRSSEWTAPAERASRALPVEDPVASPDFGGRVSTAPAAVSTASATASASSHTPLQRNVASMSANGGASAWSSVAVALPGAAGLSAAALAGTLVVRDRGFYLRFGKRACDVAGALLGLVVALPVMALAALAIKLESRGPIFYRSKRVGRGGITFTFLKLRSMVDGADRQRHRLSHLNESDGPVFKMARDPRVTRVGRFLRTTSVDELPQLWNVLRGEMSLVGPRPPIPEEVGQYEPWQMRRLEVRPGITCLWQISGRSRIGFQEWMRLDLEYIRHRSLGLDLKILVRTLPAVLSREGAY